MDISQNLENLNDNEAEKAVLGCMIYDNNGISIATEKLRPEDFYKKGHNLIFGSIFSMYEDDIPVDIVTLRDRLNSLNILDVIGGYNYIIELFNNISTSALTAHYAKIVKEKSTRRKILSASKEISNLSFDQTQTVDNILEKSEKVITSISSSNEFDDIEKIDTILMKSINKIEDLYKNKSRITGIETGFYDFDVRTAGLQNSDFILIAARPSMGKTAFVMNIASFVACHRNITTVIFSLEMSKEQLVNRMISSEGLVDAQRIRTGQIQNDDWFKIVETVGILSKSQIFIEDNASISITEIRAKCKKLKKENNLGLVIIDYLQLMSGNGKVESRQQEISSISRSLKGLARELDVPVVALSQLSRAVEQRKPPRPMLSDLRESGAIEQDADLVCFLYRDEYYNPETERKGQAEVIIAKQRNGEVGTITLTWLNQYTKFRNFERNHIENND